MGEDRIRAKKPVQNIERWNSGEIVRISNEDGKYKINLSTESDNIDLIVSESIYELFTRRLESDNPIGEDVFFIQKEG